MQDLVTKRWKLWRESFIELDQLINHVLPHPLDGHLCHYVATSAPLANPQIGRLEKYFWMKAAIFSHFLGLSALGYLQNTAQTRIFGHFSNTSKASFLLDPSCTLWDDSNSERCDFIESKTLRYSGFKVELTPQSPWIIFGTRSSLYFPIIFRLLAS